MTTKTIARGAKTRTANKNKRRDFILECAGKIIATKGYDALTLSQLATDAGVTVPTIHNLIGKKSQIFQTIIVAMVDRIAVVLNRQPEGDPTAAMEAFVSELMVLFEGNEALYKAAFLAGDRSDQFEQRSADGIYAKSLHLSVQICEQGQNKGFLRGTVAPDILGFQIFGCHRLARQDWMQGHIDLTEYQRNVLLGTYLLLRADATPTFAATLDHKIKTLS